MGKSWDSSGIAFDKDMWADLLRILKPGGHLLAFSGSRTYHRMAVAIEDAGFEIRDMIEWVYGSGFPKSLNIGKSVNQLETNEWTNISKALDNIQKTDIIRVWKSNSNSVNIVAELSQRPATEAGTHTDLSDSVLLSVVLPASQEKQNTSADTVEIALSVHRATPTRTNTVLQNVVAEIKQLQKPVKFAEILSLSQNHKHSTTSTAQESVKDTPSENTANKIRVEEALKTLRGKKKYSDGETINAICAVLTENLLHTILSQSKTFQSLDTTSKTECASAITVTITEYMAECLTTYTVGIAKSKAVDKIQGNEREDLGEHPYAARRPRTEIESNSKAFDKGTIGTNRNLTNTKGNSPYEGYGTALKPAHEPCVLARKPIEGTVANNVLKHGTGGLNIDGTRVGTNGGTARDGKADKPNNSGWENMRGHGIAQLNTGRFPANLIHDGSDEVEAVFPQTKSGGGTKVTGRGEQQQATWSLNRKEKGKEWQPDSGSASRFFYCAKSSKSERNAGLEGFEEVKKNTLNSYGDQSGVEQGDGATRVGDKGSSVAANFHPTVKPLSLTKYLATLIKPPTGGRLLVPFSGSGSEMIGALQAGWEYVEGVELTEEYIPIAEARIKYWLEKKEAENPQVALDV